MASNQIARHISKLVLIASLFSCSLLFAACTGNTTSEPVRRWDRVGGYQLKAEQAGRLLHFSIPVDDAMIADGAPFKIRANGAVQRGWLRFELRRPDGQTVWNSDEFATGAFRTEAEYTLTTGQGGEYSLGLVYGDDTTAIYNLSWYAIKLGPALLLPGLGMILAALACIGYCAWRGWLDWRYLGLGVLFWALTNTVKYAYSIQVNPLVTNTLGLNGDNPFTLGNIAASLYIGAVAGIFEAGLAWLILSRIRWGRAAWNQALVFGVGFGAIEALLPGLAELTQGLIGIFAPQAMSVAALGSMASNANFLIGFTSIIDRIALIFAHIFMCVLIFYAITSGENKWGWFAILYKTLLEIPPTFAMFWVPTTIERILTLEAVVAIFGLIGLLGTSFISRRYRYMSGSRQDMLVDPG